MSKEELHGIATDATPSKVSVPNTWGGLLIWAAGEWGVGIIFAAMLIPVYTDLKASNQQVAEISKANIIILTQLSLEIRGNSERATRIEDTLDDLSKKINN